MGTIIFMNWIFDNSLNYLFSQTTNFRFNTLNNDLTYLIRVQSVFNWLLIITSYICKLLNLNIFVLLIVIMFFIDFSDKFTCMNFYIIIVFVFQTLSIFNYFTDQIIQLTHKLLQCASVQVKWFMIFRFLVKIMLI